MWLLIQTLIKYRCDFESQETLIKDNQTKISDLSSENEKLIKDTSLQVGTQGYQEAENTFSNKKQQKAISCTMEFPNTIL